MACQIAADEILAAVDALRARTDMVVINGDLFDLERGTVPFLKRELRLLEAVHHRVVAALTGPDFCWVRGNHDRVLLDLGRALPAIDVELPCGLFRIEHGDRFNAFIKRNESFTTMMTWLSGRLQIAPALLPFYKTMRAADHLLTGAATSKDEPIAAKSARWDTVSHLQGDGPVEELAKAVEEALRLRSRKATWCMVELVDELKV